MQETRHKGTRNQQALRADATRARCNRGVEKGQSFAAPESLEEAFNKLARTFAAPITTSW